MTTRYTSSFDQTIAFSDTDAQLALTANNVLTYTLPGNNTNKYTVLFGYNSNSNIFIGYNVTAAVPAADSINTDIGVEFKPYKRYAIGGDVLSFITPDATAWMGLSVRFIPN